MFESATSQILSATAEPIDPTSKNILEYWIVILKKNTPNPFYQRLGKFDFPLNINLT